MEYLQMAYSNYIKRKILQEVEPERQSKTVKIKKENYLFELSVSFVRISGKLWLAIVQEEVLGCQGHELVDFLVMDKLKVRRLITISQRQNVQFYS